MNSHALAAALTPRPLPGRVLIVDDSTVARAVMGRILGESGRFEVAGAVSGATAALEWLSRESVDVILLDLVLPGIDGLTALPDLIAAGQGARVLVVSSTAGEGAAATVQALALGAADTLVKPQAGALGGGFAAALLARLDRLTGDPGGDEPQKGGLVAACAPPARIDVLAIGASTGGIHALARLLRALPADFDAPILITQHLPAPFLPYFAAQVAVLADRPCDVAADGMALCRGRVLVAPGDAHLRCQGRPGEVWVRLDAAPVASGNMPSVDPMFASVAASFGERACAVVLSGMGRDGLEGARRIAERGGLVLAQDRESSVVWGMPGAVVRAGVARGAYPPERIARMLERAVSP